MKIIKTLLIATLLSSPAMAEPKEEIQPIPTTYAQTEVSKTIRLKEHQGSYIATLYAEEITTPSKVAMLAQQINTSRFGNVIIRGHSADSASGKALAQSLLTSLLRDGQTDKNHILTEGYATTAKGKDRVEVVIIREQSTGVPAVGSY